MRRPRMRLRARTSTVHVTIVGGPWDGLAAVIGGDPDDFDHQIPIGDVGGYQLCDVAVRGSRGDVTYRWLPACPPVPGRPVAHVDGETARRWWAHMLSCPAGLGDVTA